MNNQTKMAPTRLYIGGMARGGTTLLSDMLSESPSIALLVEYNFSKFLRDLSNIFAYHYGIVGFTSPSTIKLLPSPIADLAPIEGVSTLQASEEPTLASNSFKLRVNDTFLGKRHYPTPDRLGEYAQNIISMTVGKPNANVIGCKTPHFFIDYDEEIYADQFVSTKYIFCLRRPLRQINSSINRRNLTLQGLDAWGVTDINAASEEYKIFLRVLISFALRSDLECLFVKYEQLVTEPAKVLSDVETFLGEEDLTAAAEIAEDESHRNALSEEELAVVHTKFSRLEALWDAIETSNRVQLADKLGAGLDPITAGTTRYSRPEQRSYLGAGWSSVEADGVWSSSRVADLIFTGQGKWLLVLTASYFLPIEKQALHIKFKWNGAVIKQATMTRSFETDGEVPSPEGGGVTVGMQREIEHSFYLVPLLIEPDRANVLRMEFDGAIVPIDHGMGADTRLLGMKLRKIHLVELDREPH